MSRSSQSRSPRTAQNTYADSPPEGDTRSRGYTASRLQMSFRDVQSSGAAAIRARRRTRIHTQHAHACPRTQQHGRAPHSRNCGRPLSTFHLLFPIRLPQNSHTAGEKGTNTEGAFFFLSLSCSSTSQCPSPSFLAPFTLFIRLLSVDSFNTSNCSHRRVSAGKLRAVAGSGSGQTSARATHTTVAADPPPVSSWSGAELLYVCRQYSGRRFPLSPSPISPSELGFTVVGTCDLFQ